MAELHTPFKIAQPIDDVRYIMRRTGRKRLAIGVQAEEGMLFINMRGKPNKHIVVQLESHSIDMRQNLVVWWYLSDCTLQFRRYRGLDGEGHSCYRITEISAPEHVKDTPSSFVPAMASEPSIP